MTVLARRETSLPAWPALLAGGVQAGVIMLLAATVGLGPAGLVTGTGATALVGTLLTRGLRRCDGHRWGPADSVTLARLALAGGVAALVADTLGGHAAQPALAGLAATALLLDAVDGQVARRTGTASAFGARFDMEADSALALVLSVFAAALLGWWVLALGVFRYAFAAASWAAPWLRAALPPRTSRKAVAALQGAVLVVACAGVLPAPQARLGLALALVFLIWSFGTDVRWLRARRAQSQERQ